MLRHALPISVLLLSTSLSAFAEDYSDVKTCPAADPTIGSSHSAFIQATLVIGTLPQPDFKAYKGAMVCSYVTNKQGNIYPYKSVPKPVNTANWIGPTSYPPLTLYACKNTDPNPCAYQVSAEAESEAG